MRLDWYLLELSIVKKQMIKNSICFAYIRVYFAT